MRERIQAFLAHLAKVRENRALPFVAALTAGFLILSLAIHSPSLLHVDHAITRAIQSLRNPFFDRLAVALTFVGNTGTLIAIGACCLVVFIWFAKPRTGFLCAALLLAVPLNAGIKPFVGRARPGGDLVDILLPTVGLSYPSGHAMGAVAFYGFLALLAWIHIQRRTVRNLFAAIFGALAAGVALSRVYVGAHWFSDVVGGMTAGLILIFIAAEVYKYIADPELAPQSKVLAEAGRVAHGDGVLE